MAGDPDLDTPEGRLRWARERAGFRGATPFARAARLKPVTYRAYESGQNGFARHAGEFAKLLHVPADWLLYGGPVPETDPPEPPGLAEFGTPDLLVDEYGIELVRQVDISYAMGDGAIVEDYPDTGFLPFNRDFLRTLTRAPVDRLFVATGTGDSMFPTLLREDVLLIDAAQQQVAEQDRIWALTFAGAGMVKRLRRLPGGRFLILSDNSSVPPQEADCQDVHIVGKLIWIGRRI